MATTRIPRDFKEFLKLLDAHSARFLLIGGYAVNAFGYVRNTVDRLTFLELAIEALFPWLTRAGQATRDEPGPIGIQLHRQRAPAVIVLSLAQITRSRKAARSHEWFCIGPSAYSFFSRSSARI